MLIAIVDVPRVHGLEAIEHSNANLTRVPSIVVARKFVEFCLYTVKETRYEYRDSAVIVQNFLNACPHLQPQIVGSSPATPSNQQHFHKRACAAAPVRESSIYEVIS